MSINIEENSKPILVKVCSIWMGILGLSLIFLDGIILPIFNSGRSFQESLACGVLGLFFITTGYWYWKLKRWATFAGVGLMFGVALLSNGFHWIMYYLSPIITAALISIHFRFSQASDKSNFSK